MSTTRKMRGPSGPTLAPESIEKKDVSNAPGNVVKSGLKFGSVRTSSMVPWITFGARMLLPDEPDKQREEQDEDGDHPAVGYDEVVLPECCVEKT